MIFKFKLYKNLKYFYNINYKNKLNIKIINIYILILIFLLIILCNLYKLQIKNYNKYYFLNEKNYTKEIPIIPSRGIIFDNNNIPIAINKKTYNLYYKYNKLNNNLLNIKKIKKFIKLNKKEIILFLIKLNNYININKNIKLKTNLNIIDIFNFYNNKNIFINFLLKNKYKRYYPYKKILSHLLGYISKNKKKIYINGYFFNKKIEYGITGIEKYYNYLLQGKIGIKKIYIDKNGNIFKIKIIKKSIPGKNIKLTINIYLQKFIFNLLTKNKNTSSLIISDIKNGEILSIISTPSYNPNIFIKKKKKQIKKILNNKNKILINRVIQENYPPASTIKPYIAISALQEKIITEKSTIFDPGWWKLPKSNKIYYDWKKWGHGLIDIKKSIEESSDLFYYQLAYNSGINKIIKWIKNFGYGEKTKIDLPNENKGFVPNKIWKKIKYKKPWYKGDTISIGIGQGFLSSTPIQINNSLQILINNGKINTLHLLKNKKNIYISKKIKNISNFLFFLIKKSMYGVAHKKNGTAFYDFKKIKYKIAAKSGTAQVSSIKNQKNRYLKNIKIKYNLKDHKLMNIFLPYKKPKFAITLILEHGEKNNKIGEIMRKIINFILLNNNLII